MNHVCDWCGDESLSEGEGSEQYLPQELSGYGRDLNRNGRWVETHLPFLYSCKTILLGLSSDSQGSGIEGGDPLMDKQRRNFRAISVNYPASIPKSIHSCSSKNAQLRSFCSGKESIVT